MIGLFFFLRQRCQLSNHHIDLLFDDSILTGLIWHVCVRLVPCAYKAQAITSACSARLEQITNQNSALNIDIMRVIFTPYLYKSVSCLYRFTWLIMISHLFVYMFAYVCLQSHVLYYYYYYYRTRTYDSALFRSVNCMYSSWTVLILRGNVRVNNIQSGVMMRDMDLYIPSDTTRSKAT